MKIGFQGDIGSNSEEATYKFIEKFNNASIVPVALVSSKNVVSALLNKEIDFGVMALNNSIIGEVVETRDAMDKNLELIDTVEIPIHHCLFVKDKNSKIRYVASHIQALMQTAVNRKNIFNNTTDIECIDTAVAAKMLAEGQYGEDYAVICRKNAGEIYGLHLMAENIEDDKTNKTLFGLFKLK